MMKNQYKLTLVLDRLRSAYNVGNIFRIAEAVQANVIACGYTPAPPHPKLAKTAMNADKTVPCQTVPSVVQAIEELRKSGYSMILAAEPGPTECEAWRRNYQYPLAIILGNEALGVSPEAMELVDGIVSLPMYGNKSSINVGNAAAAIVYAILSKQEI